MPSPVARRGCGEESPLGAVEVARLESQRRLALGAAHTVNNALTAVLGEVAFLRDERKGDAAVVEACDAVARELERCVKAAAALLPRKSASGPGRRTSWRAPGRGRAHAATLGPAAELEVRAPTTYSSSRGREDRDLAVVLSSRPRSSESAVRRGSDPVEPRGAGGARLALKRAFPRPASLSKRGRTTARR